MQVLECTHRFILTDSEQVCELCGYTTPSELEEAPFTVDKAVSLYDHGNFIGRAQQYNYMQRYVDQQFNAHSIRRAQYLTSIYLKELGINHPVLKYDTINMYQNPNNTKLIRGRNLTLTIAACMYICAQRMHVTITIAQLIDIILKYDLPLRLALNQLRKDKIRHIKKLLSATIRKWVIKNSLYYARNDKVHDVIALISQVGAQNGYSSLAIRQAIDMATEILRHDPIIFAGGKPGVYAAVLVYIAYGGKILKKTLANDFKITDPPMLVKLKRLIELLDRYGIKHPEIPRIRSTKSLV